MDAKKIQELVDMFFPCRREELRQIFHEMLSALGAVQLRPPGRLISRNNQTAQASPAIHTLPGNLKDAGDAIFPCNCGDGRHANTLSEPVSRPTTTLTLRTCVATLLLTLAGCGQSAAISPTANTEPHAVSVEVLQLTDVDDALRTEVCFGRLSAAPALTAAPATNPPDTAKPTVQIDVKLAPRVASRVTDEQRFWIGLGRKAIPARIATRVPAEANSDQRFALELTEDVDSDQWSVGQVVEIRFFLDTGQTGFWLPISALQRNSDGQWCVFAVENKIVVSRNVDVKFTEGEFALVDGKITAGEIVLTDGGHRVVPGQRVQVRDVSATMALPFQRESAP